MTTETLEWSPQQAKALTAVDQWLSDWNCGEAEQLFRLFGYAGTGKTTLARHMASQADGLVLFAAYTGKAALVLRQKGCRGASTIHSLIYKPVQKDDTRLEALKAALEEIEDTDSSDYLDLKKQIDEETKEINNAKFTLNLESELREASLLVIDECSMVDKKIAEDLMYFSTPILILGDPGQLPPIHGTGYFINAQPDLMLTEIHRQARDNPIIELATRVRKGMRIAPGKYGDSVIASKKHLRNIAGLNRMDQVLVGRNVIRRELNKEMRQQLGFKVWYPQTGDRLICLRNNPDMGWFNGEQFDLYEGSSEAPKPDQTFHLQIKETRGALVHPEPFQGQDIPKTLPFWERCLADEFDYGYAVTVHKAQGSQWDKICLLDESARFRGSEAKWLYTGITRAAERIVVLR